MTIEELQDKHEEIIGESDLGVIEALKDSVVYDEEALYTSQRTTRLSIEFAISVLEDVYFNTGYIYFIEDKIQELKQHLNK